VLAIESQRRQLLSLISNGSKDGGSSAFDPLVNDLEGTISLYLRKSIDKKDLLPNIQVKYADVNYSCVSKIS